jgi:proteasome lid subunit RPN8/RPN11
VRGILLSEAHARRLLAWARAARPREACGLLIGRRVDGLAVVERAIETRNTAEGPERFEVDPLDHLTAQREARAAGLEILGAWHSHPEGPATPSAGDAREALPGWVQVIVDARSTHWRAWVVESGGAARELARSR